MTLFIYLYIYTYIFVYITDIRKISNLVCIKWRIKTYARCNQKVVLIIYQVLLIIYQVLLLVQLRQFIIILIYKDINTELIMF